MIDAPVAGVHVHECRDCPASHADRFQAAAVGKEVGEEAREAITEPRLQGDAEALLGPAEDLRRYPTGEDAPQQVLRDRASHEQVTREPAHELD
jgi:hypothetical protein